jgi:hypothetical protein
MPPSGGQLALIAPEVCRQHPEGCDENSLRLFLAQRPQPWRFTRAGLPTLA